MLFKKNETIGIDIGENSLKLALIESDKPKIKCLFYKELIKDRASSNQCLSEEELRKKITEIIAEFQREAHYTEKSAFTAIQGEGTICGYLELPEISKKEQETAVQSQVIKQIPFPLEKVVISYLQVPQLDKGPKKTCVFWVCAQKSSVEKQKTLLSGCGLEIKKMEVPSLAIAREFARNHKFSDDKFFAIVHIGYKLTHIVVINAGFPYYARDFSLAGRDFTYAFQMGAQISWKEAELYKLNYDATLKETAIEPFLMNWLDEVKKSLKFFNNQIPFESYKIETIYLSGGSAYMKNLDKRLSEHVNMTVLIEKWDIIKNEEKNKEKNDAINHLVSVGLALNSQ